MSRQHDDVRLSYERNTAELPRQCVIYGTTNDTKYLRDVPGGRRYLPVIVPDEFIDSIAIMEARDGLWRAAYEAYDDMVAKTPHGHDLPLYLAVAVLFGIGYGVSYPILVAMAANDADPDLGAQTLQIFALTYFVGIFGFPLIAGWLIVDVGARAVLALIAVLALLEASLALRRAFKPLP